MDVPLAREDGNNSRDWRELGLVVDREVPPPPCLVRREEEEELKAEENLECKTNSIILDCGRGKGLSAPFPNASAPSTPMWRPLEEKDEEEVVDLSAALQKRKRKSPAAAARSRQRFLQRQEKRNTHRLQLELRNTPHQSIETSKTWTRLTKRPKKARKQAYSEYL